MALLQISHFSEALGLTMSCTVILPQEAPGQIGMEGGATATGRYPTLWLLHGRSDDHTIWLRRTSIERYLTPLGAAAVMPNVHLSYYTNLVHGGRYWDYISDELPQLLERWLPIAVTREQRYVAGLSMGGWGAFKLALNQPDRFCAAASLSGALRFSLSDWKSTRPTDAEATRYLHTVFGESDDFPNPEDRLIERVREHRHAGRQLPRLFACCGTEDFLLESNRNAVRQLRDEGVDVDYEEGPGVHEWAFWDTWIQRVLEWMDIS